MASKHLSHDEFFTKLAALFTTRHGKDSGSINLVQKRLTTTAQDPNDPLADLKPPTDPLPILIRAHDGTSKPHPKFPKKTGSKTKLSTVVDAADLDTFYTRYADVCKAGMSGLKKRDRKKAKAKKGKGGKTSGGAS